MPLLDQPILLVEPLPYSLTILIVCGVWLMTRATQLDVTTVGGRNRSNTRHPSGPISPERFRCGRSADWRHARILRDHRLCQHDGAAYLAATAR